ncbi:MAG: hypothetical protein KGI80_00620 [Verrucomicrobiota bacterium]|nr:hypothetical protein [Verrucomicrobiota bacterium]
MIGECFVKKEIVVGSFPKKMNVTELLQTGVRSMMGGVWGDSFVSTVPLADSFSIPSMSSVRQWMRDVSTITPVATGIGLFALSVSGILPAWISLATAVSAVFLMTYPLTRRCQEAQEQQSRLEQQLSVAEQMRSKLTRAEERCDSMGQRLQVVENQRDAWKKEMDNAIQQLAVLHQETMTNSQSVSAEREQWQRGLAQEKQEHEDTKEALGKLIEERERMGPIDEELLAIFRRFEEQYRTVQQREGNLSWILERQIPAYEEQEKRFCELLDSLLADERHAGVEAMILETKSLVQQRMNTLKPVIQILSCFIESERCIAGASNNTGVSA